MAQAGMNPKIADEVPWSETITEYDESHYVVYLRLLDASNDGASNDEGWGRQTMLATGGDIFERGRQRLLTLRDPLAIAPLCEELEKRKRRNQGPTVANTPVPQHRRGHEVPPTTGPDRPNWNPNVSKDVQEITQDGDIVWTNMGPAVAPESDVNIGLTGVHDLLKGE